MTDLGKRKEVVTMLKTAIQDGARQRLACNIVGISCRTFQRWKGDLDKPDGRPSAKHPTPANKLTDQERSEVLALCHSPEYQSSPPSQIVPALADKGQYIASESTCYRILKEEKEQTHRGRARQPHKHGKPRSHTATHPNQVWTWDVTWLKGPVRGLFFYLYMIVDIYSRKIVGWEVWDAETGEKAKLLVQRAVLKEGCANTLEVLHADNGSIQKAYTLREKLDDLNVQASYSRPRVSDDNAYSESLFRTCKYRPDFPIKGFETIETARKWVYQFVEWYNGNHLHSGIQFVTPNAKHNGHDVALLANRHDVYEQAKERNPLRWSGKTRNWEPVEIVHLNKPKDEVIIKVAA